MTTSRDNLKDRLARYRQIQISVIGRKSARTISLPVWCVLDGDKLYLLPVEGSDTQWFRNLRRNPEIRISARGKEATFPAKLVRGAKAVGNVVAMFRAKYGSSDVKMYYSKFDAAVLVPLEKAIGG